MKKLKAELLRLKDKGESSLAAEIEALIEASEDSTPQVIPLSRRFLALAAQEIQNGKIELGHDCIGTAVEMYQAESEGETLEIAAHVKGRLDGLTSLPSEAAFTFPLPDIAQDVPFGKTTKETVTEFANLLINAGYAEEAKKYVSAFNHQTTSREDTPAMDKKAMKEVREYFKKQGNLAMVHAAEELMQEMGDQDKPATSASTDVLKKAGEEKNSEVKATLMKAGYMLKAAEEMDKEGKTDDAEGMKSLADDMLKEAKTMKDKSGKDATGCGDGKEETMASADGKIPLYVDDPTPEENRLSEVAARATQRGDFARAKRALVKAKALKKMRVISALIKAGDMDMAMEALEDEHEPGNGGYNMNAEGHNEGEEKKEEVEEKMGDSEMPEAAHSEDEESKEREEPEAEEEQPEEDMAKDMVEEVKSSVKKKNMRAAVVAFTRLNALEIAVVKGVKVARSHLAEASVVGNRKDKKEVAARAKDKKEAEALAKEGFKVWREVRKQRLIAELFLAKAEKDDEVQEEAMQAMNDMEDESKAAEELDKTLESVDDVGDEEPKAEGDDVALDSPELPPGGVKEGEPGVEEPKEEGETHPDEGTEEPKEETDAMHYEVLQSVAELKALKKIDRNALAFTYWEDESGQNPFYVVQAAGKPIAAIHLQDQDDPEAIKAYFCDDQKYTKALAQSVENTSLYDMLTGVRAHFYANEVDASTFADKVRKEAVASLAGTRTEKLASLRKDFMDTMIVAAEAMNKGVYSNKPNPLKASFAKVLASYGINNPAVAVEAAFKEGGKAFFDSVMDGATEYLEMPKEAFVHAKKMVEQATHVAYATAQSFTEGSIGERLGRNSMPFAPAPEAYEAPAVQASLQDQGERARKDDLKSRLQLSRKL